jgi:hypothetical protein
MDGLNRAASAAFSSYGCDAARGSQACCAEMDHPQGHRWRNSVSWRVPSRHHCGPTRQAIEAERTKKQMNSPANVCKPAAMLPALFCPERSCRVRRAERLIR